MTRAEMEPGAQAKTENKPGDENANTNAAEVENEAPLVVRPKVRTQIMTGARPKVKPRAPPGARPRIEASSPGGAYPKYKPKSIPVSRSRNDAQVWAPNRFRADPMSKMGKQSHMSTANSPLVSTDSGAIAQAKGLSVDRELGNMDTESYPRRANSQAGFQHSFGPEEGPSTGTWYRSRPAPKGEASENSDFRWADKPSGSSSFWNRDEPSTRFRPRKNMKTNNPRHKNKQEFYNISSSDSEDESSSFCSGEEAKSRTKPRVRKGVNMRARHQAKREAYNDGPSGSVDTSKKESWFLPEDKAGAFAKSKIKKEPRTRAMPKEEVKTKARANTKQETRSEEEVLGITGSWFWSGEARIGAGSQTVETGSETEEEAIFESLIWAAKKNIIRPAVNRVSKPEGEEAETMVGPWFWEGDETAFESNPTPVFKATCEPMSSTEQEPDPSRRPQSWDEVTVQFKPGPWGKAGFPSISPFRFPKEAASLFAEMFGGKPRADNLGAEGEQGSSGQPGSEFPFQYDPSYRSVQEIREHLKARDSAQPESWSCSCVQCDLRISSEEFEELLLIMDRNQDPFIHEISKIAMGMRSASPFTRDFIRNSGVISLIEALLNYPSSRARTTFLENMVRVSPPYPDLNMIQTYVCQVCEDTFDYDLDSADQLSGLTMITHLTATSDYHKMVAKYLSGFFYLLNSGNTKTRLQVLKLLLNLSENLAMTKHLLTTESMSEFMALFNKEDSNDNVQIVLAIFDNISKNIQKEALFADDDDDDEVVVNLEPLISAFQEIEKIAKQLKRNPDNQKSP
uniref:Armadillo repeat-containing domain-containing protein n=1 Tax=Peromyscus maniculatus bairdii TaxID=230844 RepID=A0A8C8W8J6_PERMB